MTAGPNILKWTLLTGLSSLLVGAAALVWASFGMPGWFFVLSQIWLWTVGLPVMLGVLLVTAVWGIPGWTTLPLWVYVPCVILAALAFQNAGVCVAIRLRRGSAERHS